MAVDTSSDDKDKHAADTSYDKDENAYLSDDDMPEQPTKSAGGKSNALSDDESPLGRRKKMPNNRLFG